MRAHRFDTMSFVFGLVFLVLAVVFSIPGLEIGTNALRWIGAGILLLIGGGLILGSATRSGRQNEEELD
jgi:hypothetical protein